MEQKRVFWLELTVPPRRDMYVFIAPAEPPMSGALRDTPRINWPRPGIVLPVGTLSRASRSSVDTWAAD